MDDSLNPQLSASLRPHDAVSAVGRIYDVHERGHLPKVQNCDHAVTKLLEKCKGKKNDMNILVHTSMQKVKSVQFSIKDTMNELHAFQEVMGHQEKEFENLKFLCGIRYAYRASLAEVVRRRSSSKLYMGLAGQLAERLAIARDAEMRQREDFLKAWGKYIPHDIFASMGLFDSPSQCNVNIAPFDGNLLQIDLVDVDRFAPQSLIGLLSKSSNMMQSEESSSHTGEKSELLETFGVCESVDIAGTSKMEVENARLKAELASAIAVICSFGADMGCDSLDEGQINDALKTMKEKTAEALQLKDEFANHLQSMLNKKQEQCLSYEKRIQELEQSLQGQKGSASKDAADSFMSALKANNSDCNLNIFGDGDAQLTYGSAMPLDELSSTSATMDQLFDKISRQTSKHGEGGDENMADLSATHSLDSTRNSMDSSMLEPPNPQQMTVKDSSSNACPKDPSNILPCGTSDQSESDLRERESLILNLQGSLEEKSNLLEVTESKLKAVMEEINSLRRELETNRNLLDESQVKG